MAKSIDNVVVALLLEIARRIAGGKKRRKELNKKCHNKTLGKLLPT